jgi:protein-ribulosamine 3-kinase
MSGADATPDRAIAHAIERAIGTPVRILRRTPLGGGSINETAHIETTAGAFVVKAHRRAPARMFQAEAEGLNALRASGTTLAIPRVIAVGPDEPGGASFLVLEHLSAGRRRADFDEALGRGIAELHRATAGQFGFYTDNYCGATPQPNPWTARWVDFYSVSRLGHQLRLATDARRLSSTEAERIESLIARLDEWIDEPVNGPSLIHGDLWSGNLHADAGGGPALIDPAAYYAHREAELGMMTLFGGFSERVFSAYDEVFALEPGWRDRNALYELYHLMNHLNLFGAGYHGQVMSGIKRFV